MEFTSKDSLVTGSLFSQLSQPFFQPQSSLAWTRLCFLFTNMGSVSWTDQELPFFSSYPEKRTTPLTFCAYKLLASWNISTITTASLSTLNPSQPFVHLFMDICLSDCYTVHASLCMNFLSKPHLHLQSSEYCFYSRVLLEIVISNLCLVFFELSVLSHYPFPNKKSNVAAPGLFLDQNLLKSNNPTYHSCPWSEWMWKKDRTEMNSLVFTE